MNKTKKDKTVISSEIYKKSENEEINKNGLSEQDNEQENQGMKMSKEEYREFLINDPDWLLWNYTIEKQVDDIKKYNLDGIPIFKKTLDIGENILRIKGKYKFNTFVDIKDIFTDILNINTDIRKDVIDGLKVYCQDDKKEYFDVLKEMVLNDDKGLKKCDEDNLNYIYFMNIENCRNYVFEDLGLIQIHGHTGLYDTISKTKIDYQKSKDILKRIKILQIKKLKDKEAFSFDSLSRFFFIDELNKNFKLTWNPNKKKTFYENGVEYYNEYSPITYQGINHNKDLSLIYYHVKHYLCSDNEEVYNYFISIISDMIYNPGRKLPVSVIMNGDGGIGKSFLFDKLFSKIFDNMYGTISNKFPSRFNSVLENKLCFLIEEFSHQDNVNESNILKNYISNPVISIERKGFEPYFSVNCIRFFICSNGEWSVRIENNNSSRRYLLCDVSETKPDNGHFEKLSELIKGDKRRGYENEEVLKETIEQFIYDMGQIDTSILETDPPETESKKLSQSFSKGIQEKQLEGFFEKVINCNGHYNSFNDCIKILDTDNDFEINSYQFWNCFIDFLKDMRQQVPNGFSNYGRILSKWFGKDYSKVDTKFIDGKRNRIYTFPRIEVVEEKLNL
jgi:hypothetical protein